MSSHRWSGAPRRMSAPIVADSHTMSATSPTTTAGDGRPSGPPPHVTTSLLILNLHCSSCSQTINELLSRLSPAPYRISTSILDQSVTVTHSEALQAKDIYRALVEAEFEVDSVQIMGSKICGSGKSSDENIITFHTESEHGTEEFTGRLRDSWTGGTRRRSKLGLTHLENCELCRSQAQAREKLRLAAGKSDCTVVSSPSFTEWSSSHQTSVGPNSTAQDVVQPLLVENEGLYQVTISIGGMTCASCSNSITDTLKGLSWVKNVSINLMGGSGTVVFDSKASAGAQAGAEKIVNEIEDTGFDCSLEELKSLETKHSPVENNSLYQATISIGGMTCASCSGSITDILQALPVVRSVSINLIGGSGTVVFDARTSDEAQNGAEKIVGEVEDVGFECVLEGLRALDANRESAGRHEMREVSLKVEGMFCEHCPRRVIDALKSTFPDLIIETPPTLASPICRIKYSPHPPKLTLRHIVSSISSISPSFVVSVYHPPTMEERSRALQLRERNRLLLRLILSIIIAIPTFLLGIVWMALVPKDNRIRIYIEQPMWAGQATRVEWALFILSTPVMFCVADVFHLRAIREIRALWRSSSSVPVLRRFYRFGSMNLLISLGVSISYFASVALLGMSAVRKKTTMAVVVDGMKMEVQMEEGHITTYFDSTVLLTMFLLMGKCLEAYSKSKTADAVSLLGLLRPSEALLIVHASDEDIGVDESTLKTGASQDPIGEKDLSNTEYSDNRPWKTRKVPTDLIEVGDVITIVRGSSPPADGTIISGKSQFDESSLTGESRLVPKFEGDSVFAGTINQGQVINVRVDSIGGDSMLDQIVKVVREGQTRRAPIERLADIITGYFVPVVTLLAVSTWLIWLGLGLSGSLPASYLDQGQGGWPVWSLGFAIAVFVIACPCGIGLAAPTALFVGSGLAARYGILAKGGGEAFQEASGLDCIVFDKTGTLTQGGAPKVTDEKLLTSNARARKVLYTISQKLEEGSAHPLAKAIVGYCEGKGNVDLVTSEIEELPGRGLHGIFKLPDGDVLEAIIGNERFMHENGVTDLEMHNFVLNEWKMAGKSIILLAIKKREGIAESSYTEDFKLMALYSATDPLRPEAQEVVRHLQENGIGVWMISGDNAKTAIAVAGMVGIPAENVIAGVLPTEKADKILHLQQTAPKRPRSRWHNLTHRHKNKNPAPHRAIIAMVGDGINDAPALSVSDVGIAIGSGSDVAIGSAKFILVSSDLRSILTLTELSRAVFRRVKFNFLWACIYNICALPIAAGVLYPLDGVRLSPVWAALAMAMSSVSVVCSSLLLKTTLYGVGFRAKQERYRQ